MNLALQIQIQIELAGNHYMQEMLVIVRYIFDVLLGAVLEKELASLVATRNFTTKDWRALKMTLCMVEMQQAVEICFQGLGPISNSS